MKTRHELGLRLASGLSLFLSLVACGGDLTDGGPCISLPRDECLKSVGCFLDYNGQPDGYFCRAANDDCERLTNDGGQPACDSVATCDWNPGTCYCPEGMNCFCGGGPPAACQEKN